MLIDMHTHVLPDALQHALERRSRAPRIVSRDSRPFIEYGDHSGAALTPAFKDPRVILASMKADGIDHSVLSVTIPGVDWFREAEAEAIADACNEELAAVVAQDPLHFSGLATVPMQAPERAVAVLQRAVRNGLKGVMIFSNVAGAHLDAPERRQFFDAAAAMQVPVLLHPTYPLCAPTLAVHAMIEIAGFLFDTTTAALRLVFDGLYERQPQIKFIVPHAGSLIPYFAGRIDHFGSAREGAVGAIKGKASDHVRRFYVDTVTNWPSAVRLCVDFFGIDRVMYGTDHPFWPMALANRTLDQVGLTIEERSKVEWENAARVFGLETGIPV